jgi:hypothetical protein
MSEVASTETKPQLPRPDGDQDAFAEVERWMALIREIGLEQENAESA